MKFGFERNIHGYNEVAADMVHGDNDASRERELWAELERKIERISERRQSMPEAQREIYGIQERKQEIMGKLKDRLTLLHNEDFTPPRRSDEALVVMEGGSLVVKKENGKSGETITKGEIITDMDWGMYYYLDPATVDRHVRRRYLLEDAKKELMDYLDEQITIDELSSRKTLEATRVAYEGRAGADEENIGFIAEKMVKNFLKKLSYDYDVDFSIVDADAHQDIAMKSDFIIRRRSHKRGVGVEESDVIERVGVQFTVNTDAEKQAMKRAQMTRIKDILRPSDQLDDVVLVTVPSQSVRGAYDEWKLDRRPGGPDKLWDIGTKEIIFRAVLRDILTPAEIDEQWRIVSGENIDKRELAAA